MTRTFVKTVERRTTKGGLVTRHDIIDNRTRELAPEINNLLADSVRVHFADQRSNLC